MKFQKNKKTSTTTTAATTTKVHFFIPLHPPKKEFPVSWELAILLRNRLLAFDRLDRTHLQIILETLQQTTTATKEDKEYVSCNRITKTIYNNNLQHVVKKKNFESLQNWKNEK